MPGWRILLLFIFISPAWVLADTHRLVSTPGKMRMRGNIIEAACYVDPRDRSLLVEFDDLSARDISGKPEKVSAHDFSIHLLGCSLGILNIPGVCFNAPILPFPAHPIVTILII
jgi:type 1 fimbria pilin